VGPQKVFQPIGPLETMGFPMGFPMGVSHGKQWSHLLNSSFLRFGHRCLGQICPEISVGKNIHKPSLKEHIYII
jgi:hypothetical protein